MDSATSRIAVGVASRASGADLTWNGVGLRVGALFLQKYGQLEGPDISTLR